MTIQRGLLILCLLIASTQAVTFTIALPPENRDLLELMVLRISDPTSSYYGEYMTPEEINAIVQPEPSVYQPVMDWLVDGNIEAVLLGDSIHCQGDVKSVEKLLKVKLYYHQERNHYHSLDEYSIPAHLTDKILFIDGISNSLLPKPALRAVDGETYYVAREVVNRLYNLSDPTLKHNSSIAAAEFMNYNGFMDSQIQVVQYENNIEINPTIRVVGKTAFNMSGETNLDLQMFAQTLQLEKGEIWYWGASSWMYTFATNFLQTAEVPQVVSMSWGWAEDKQCTIVQCTSENSQQYVDRTNIEFLKIALRGVTLLAAAGDAGAPGRTAESCPSKTPLNPIYPGSSPWLTSVGATYVTDNTGANQQWETRFCEKYDCANGNSQAPCNYAKTGWTTGGGFGYYSSELTPPWQDKAVVGYLRSGVPLPYPYTYDFTGRGYPDVAMNGHNCPTWMFNGVMPIDGTSCASPLFASMVALINDYQVSRGRPLVGFINPLLYRMWTDDSTTFTDITEGNNWCTENECCPTNANGGSDFGFLATKGWDPVSGIGYPNMGRIFNWLDANTYNKRHAVP